MSTKFKILIINGPNLNLLGRRESSVYGTMTLADIEESCRTRAIELGVELEFFQSNHEGVLIDRIQQSKQHSDLIIINPAAYTHTSIAIRDALLAVDLPVIELHISNIHKRESFRKHSTISDIAIGQIVGMGPKGYLLALDGGVNYLEDSRP
ncbi:MAG: type II 3-dehydroquinate dehydratase [Magnetococcales bacterium]|nr:type II 3-dehydroquinate dehydratase [Magnetococcales bacterium]